MQCFAGCVMPIQAAMAFHAGHMMRNKNPVADLEVFDIFPNFIDYAAYFMPKNQWGFFYPVPFHDISAADSACNDFDKNFIIANFRDWPFLYSNIIVVVIDCNAHIKKES